MRLLDVKTLQLREFQRPPPYTILSHTWDDSEITFKDFISGDYRNLPGYSKLKRCCELSRLEGYHYTWIDTCCIDKTSSAELSEAINSMFQWYKGAAVCYAYLSDVRSAEDLPHSRWFKRGWTLQELIAPDIVVLLDSDWKELGTRSSLSHTLSRITRIDETVLLPERGADVLAYLDRYNIAAKMSWAADRETTRIEDRAYSLMGLFDINMPLLYGEGERAFLRLQQHIMENSNDYTIFTWESEPEIVQETPGPFRTGLLAYSPACFRHFHDVKSDALTYHTSEELWRERSYQVSTRLKFLNLPWFREVDVGNFKQ